MHGILLIHFQQISSPTALARTCPSLSSRTGAAFSPPSSRSLLASALSTRRRSKASRTTRTARLVLRPLTGLLSRLSLCGFGRCYGSFAGRHDRRYTKTKKHWNGEMCHCLIQNDFRFFEGVLDPSKSCLRGPSAILKLSSHVIIVSQPSGCDSFFCSNEVGILQVGMSLRLSSNHATPKRNPIFRSVMQGYHPRTVPVLPRASRPNAKKQIHKLRIHFSGVLFISRVLTLLPEGVTQHAVVCSQADSVDAGLL